MDPNIEKSARYYQLVIDRLEKSGRAPRQLEVYRKILAEVKDSASREEIEERLKKTGLDLAPGNALVQDKVFAHHEAARDAGQEDIANVYREYHDKMTANPGETYALSAEYPEKLKPFFEKNNAVLSALVDLYTSYCMLRFTHSSLDTIRKKYIDRINAELKKIEEAGLTFAKAIALPYFRDHIPPETADDFAARIPEMASWSPKDEAGERELQEQARSALEELKDKKDELKTIRDEEEARKKRSMYSAVAAGNEEGEYLYEEVWQKTPV